MNPHKWKKYSLEDADISDRSNTSAALAFLKEIEGRKDQEPADSGSESEASKIVFSRSRNNPRFQRSVQLQRVLESNEEDDSPKATFKTTKVVMPEYNFGESKKAKKAQPKKSKNESTDRKPGKTLQLDHLLAEDEDDATED